MTDKQVYEGLEIIGELETWQFNVRSAASGALIPDLKLQFKVIQDGHSMTFGEEAIKELEKAQQGNDGLGLKTHYARVRVDFYTEDLRDSVKDIRGA